MRIGINYLKCKNFGFAEILFALYFFNNKKYIILRENLSRYCFLIPLKIYKMSKQIELKLRIRISSAAGKKIKIVHSSPTSFFTYLTIHVSATHSPRGVPRDIREIPQKCSHPLNVHTPALPQHTHTHTQFLFSRYLTGYLSRGASVFLIPPGSGS